MSGIQKKSINSYNVAGRMIHVFANGGSIFLKFIGQLPSQCAITPP